MNHNHNVVSNLFIIAHAGSQMKRTLFIPNDPRRLVFKIDTKVEGELSNGEIGTWLH